MRIDSDGRRLPPRRASRWAGLFTAGAVGAMLGLIVGYDNSPSADCQKERASLRSQVAGLEADAAIGWLVGYAAVAQSKRGLDLMTGGPEWREHAPRVDAYLTGGVE